MLQTVKGFWETLRPPLIVVSLLLVVPLALMMERCTQPAPAPAYSVVEAQVNPVVDKEVKVDTPIVSPKKTVRTYTASAKGLITLPADVVADPAKHITESSVMASSEKRQVITQVLDTTTGETKSYVTQAPDPWFATENRGSLTFDYGFKRRESEPVVRMNVRQDFLQVKAVHLGVSATAYSDGDYFVGVGGSYRW